MTQGSAGLGGHGFVGSDPGSSGKVGGVDREDSDRSHADRRAEANTPSGCFRMRARGEILRPNHDEDRVRGMRPMRQHVALGVAALAFFVAGLVPAAGAMAAEVVDVRVGAHPKFTRVVFELDRSAGFRLERSGRPGASPELVVTIDATSIPRNLKPPSRSVIGPVKVSSYSGKTIARIALADTALITKRSVLDSPYRIVVDVYSAGGETTSAAAAKPKPEPSPKPVAKAEPAAEPKAPAKPAARPAVTPAAPPAPKPEPKALARSAPTRKPADPSPGLTEPAEPEAAVSSGAPGSGPLAGGEPSEGAVPTMGREAVARKVVATPSPQPKLGKKASSKPAAAPLAKAPITEESSGGYGTLAMAVGALVLVAGGVVFAMRRRGASSDAIDDLDAEDLSGDPDGLDENPFARLNPEKGDPPPVEASLFDSEESGSPLAAEPDSDPELRVGESAEPELDFGSATAEPEPVSMDLEEDVGATTEVIADVGSAASSALPSDLEENEEVMRMLREFERRIASLETRLDEVVDARERLERQVAAQTEELRVQRAAIARTQRAVRNMNRPEEEGPTEPALRDPS